MTFNLFDLTYRLARELGGRQVVEGYATGGSTSTIVDANDRGETDNTYWEDGAAWILHDAGGAGAAPQGEMRIIDSFNASTDTITLRAPVLTAAVAAGDRYALAKKRYRLSELVQRINSALMELGPVPVFDKTSLTVLSGQTEYTLPAAANVNNLRQVWLQRDNSNANDNRWQEIIGWRVEKAATGSAGVLHLPRQYSSGYALMLVYVDYHPELLEQDDELSEAVHPDLVVYTAATKQLRDYAVRTRNSAIVAGSLDDLENKKALAFLRHPIVLPKKPGRLLITTDQSSYYPGDRNPV